MALTIYPGSMILGVIVGWGLKDAVSSRKEIKKWWDSLWGI
ncbi:hypothetical protein [Bombilactobacillus bombi]|nr:hypothetical protein [Bombilactobacillus bombi]